MKVEPSADVLKLLGAAVQSATDWVKLHLAGTRTVLRCEVFPPAA